MDARHGRCAWVAAIVACALGCAACGQADSVASERENAAAGSGSAGSTPAAAPPAGSATPVAVDRSLKALRIEGWKLFEPFTRTGPGLPDPAVWTPSAQVLTPPGSSATPPAGAMRPATEHVGTDQGLEPPLYEITFFNTVAKEFIETQGLNARETTYRLLNEQRREIEFPRDAAALKLFWYVLKKDRSVNVRVWNWNETQPKNPGNPTLDVSRLGAQCVAEVESNECLAAEKHFHTVRVADPGQFLCIEGDCLPLEQGDLLILVGMHIVAKTRPEWLWTTFWWQGPDASSGNDWTCADAQRAEAIGTPPLPWRNYAMDVTASFMREKPYLDSGSACGVPKEIAGRQEYLATYNPFVEARVQNGLKSSCIDCHSRASTDFSKPDDVPPISETGGPTLRSFERHIRVDYMWSLWRTLGKTPIE